MSRDDVKPPRCHARAVRALDEITLVRDAMGRSADERPVPEIGGAVPREVYFEALALWRKADRLASEVGAGPGTAPATPSLAEIEPGHVLRLIDASLERISNIKVRVGVDAKSAEPPIEEQRQPADVLTALLRCNRQLSRCLERPFTPEDVYRQVSLASAYASSLLAARRRTVAAAPFEARKRPADCYQRLELCLAGVGALVRAAGHTVLSARGAVTDVVPGDVYDLASVVLGEVAFLHAITPRVPPVHAFDPAWQGHRLPSHVYQLARTLEAQLGALAD
jgi:hypothetical protein